MHWKHAKSITPENPTKYCIVLYAEALYWRPIGPLSYRHSSGVVRNPHSALAEWEIFNLRSISPQGTHLLIARRRNSITRVLVTISWMTCLSATCEPRTINLSITGERITSYNVASRPRTSLTNLACHWRALCLLAYDNWRCSIQPEIFHSLKCRAGAGTRSRIDSGRVQYANH